MSEKEFYIKLCDALKCGSDRMARDTYAGFSVAEAQECVKIAVNDAQYGQAVLDFLFDYTRRDYTEPHGPQTPMELRNINYQKLFNAAVLSDEIIHGDEVKMYLSPSTAKKKAPIRIGLTGKESKGKIYKGE